MFYKQSSFSWLSSDEVVYQASQNAVTSLKPDIEPSIGDFKLSYIDLSDLGCSLWQLGGKFSQNQPAGDIVLSSVVQNHAPNLFSIHLVQEGRNAWINNHDLNIASTLTPKNCEIKFNPLAETRLEFHIEPVGYLFNQRLGITATDIGRLFGNEEFDVFKVHCGLTPSNHIVTHPISVDVGHVLKSAIKFELSGAAQRLHAISCLCGFLSSLIQDNQKKTFLQSRAHKIKKYIESSEGRIIDSHELAMMFKSSVKSLNDEFVAEFGQTIFNMSREFSFQIAYRAIVETKIPLKNISANMGYSHPSYFNAAFKKRFGIPPGQLRK